MRLESEESPSSSLKFNKLSEVFESASTSSRVFEVEEL